KPKRRRANAKQLEVLNRVFERTSFPTTQVRNELGQQLGMSPRTVQIWFQNRRQAIRMQEKKQPKE
ncbi:Homeodomain-like DNA binding domain-containing transcription factor, partial [Phycomyces blakesleeanus NRRL 1555(-)]